MLQISCDVHDKLLYILALLKLELVQKKALIFGNTIGMGQGIQSRRILQTWIPGIIVIEGEKGVVGTYLRQLQNLHWQAMSIRGEEEEEVPHGKEIDDMRHFLKGVKELHECGMSELGRFC